MKLTPYQAIVIDEFRKSFESARVNIGSDIDSDSIERHPLLVETLCRIDDMHLVDDVSRVLSERGDELKSIAEESRNSPEWAVTCIAMGAVRNAAAQAWRI